MHISFKSHLRIAFIGIGIFAFVSSAFARETLFKPTIADVDIATPGLERIAVTEDGSVIAFSYEGNLLPGFPVWIDGFIAVSSPVIANVVGDGLEEIIVVARNNQDAHRLYALSNQGQILSSTDIIGEVYYDPVVMSRSDSPYDDVLVAATSGSVQRFRFDNNLWSGAAIFDLGVAAGLAVAQNDIVINYPERNVLEVYSEANGAWGRRSSFATPNPVLYPVVLTDDGNLIGILRNGQLASIVRATGQMNGGFPIALDGTPRGPVLAADVQSDNAGVELVIGFSDGRRTVLRTNGTVLSAPGEKQFTNLSFESSDALSNAGYSLLNAYVNRIINQQITRLVSYLGRLSIPSVAIGTGEIDVLVNGTALPNGSIFTLGSVNVGETRDVTVTIDNPGASPLQLSGNPVVGGPDAALFTVTALPRVVIAARSRTQMLIRFTAQSTGSKVAQIRVTSNDADESQYVFVLRADVVNNIIRDGNMEAVLLPANWIKWGTVIGYEKSSVFSVSPRQSMHHTSLNTHTGFQQLNVPVRAGQRYRYSLRYKLISGRVETNLGIRSSNSDFEAKPGVLNRANGEWQKYTREFTVPQNFVKDFRVVIRVVSGEAYVDDVVLEEIPQVVPPIVIDGTMESEGIGVWVPYGRPLVMEKTALTTHGGVQSFHIVSQANFGFQQLNIVLRAGQQYRLRAWYRNNGGTLIPRISTNNSSVDFEFRNGDPREPLLGNTNGEWRLYERTFTALANYVGPYRAVFMHSNADFGPPYRNLPQGEVWVDDVTIEEIVP